MTFILLILYSEYSELSKKNIYGPQLFCENCIILRTSQSKRIPFSDQSALKAKLFRAAHTCIVHWEEYSPPPPPPPSLHPPISH